MKTKKISQSISIISDVMQPSQANPAGNVHGGEIMKMMDTCAGVTAMRHANSNVVTLRVDELIFYKPIFVGQLVICESKMVFTGRTSMEINVTVKVEDMQTDTPPIIALTAYFTFVALDSNGHTCDVPQLELATEEEKCEFEKRKQRYLSFKNKKSSNDC